jgi:antitoxin (DNA-binding transcriptional repressor) of toxin-antitoxin stability system
MPITASKLRENIYNILDEAIETGVPVEVIRKGVILRIVPQKQHSKLARLKRRSDWIGDPEDIFKMDYLEEWRKEWNISDEEWNKTRSST